MPVAHQGARRPEQLGARHRRAVAGQDRRQLRRRAAARICSATRATRSCKSQATAALALLSGGGGNKHAKIYLAFGPFTGGVKSAGPEASKIIADALARELGKLPSVTLSLSAADQHNFAKTGMLGFFIDGNITRLEDVVGGGRLGDELRRQGDGGALADEEHHQLDQRGRQPAVGLAAARQGERAAGLPRGVGRPAGRRSGAFFQVARRIDRMDTEMRIGRVS